MMMTTTTYPNVTWRRTPAPASCPQCGHKVREPEPAGVHCRHFIAALDTGSAMGLARSWAPAGQDELVLAGYIAGDAHLWYAFRTPQRASQQVSQLASQQGPQRGVA